MDWMGLHDRWLAVQAHCGRESAVAKALLIKGYDIYLPTLSSSVASSISGSAPLFPGYLFLRYSKRNRASILNTYGLIRIVGLGMKPLPIDDWEIDSVRKVCSASAPVSPCEYAAGSPAVTIRGGPLNGVRGTILRCHNNSRLILSVHMLQRSIQMEIPTSDAVICNGPAMRACAHALNRTLLCCNQTASICSQRCV